MPALDFNAPHGPVLVFFAAAVAVCVTPWIAERGRVPGLIGLLVGGYVIGPYGLGVIEAHDTILPALGQLGLLYLMFLAGAELDFDVISEHRRPAIVFSLLTFGAPLIAGYTLGTLLDYGIATSLLLGSLWASHTLLAYPIVRNAGLAAHPAVAATVGATVVTDTLSLVVLAAVAGSAAGSVSGSDLAAQIIVGLVVLCAWCAIALPRIGAFFFARIAHEPALRYAFILAALLSAGVLAEVVGIEAIVGAFFAGLGLNRLLPNAGPLFHRLEFFGNAILIPLFLVSVGLIINPAVMVEPETLGLAAGFSAAVLIGKGIAAAACRFLFRYTWPEVGVVFSLSVAQAAATLAATFVGFRVGLLGESAVNAVLIVILVTVVLSSVSAQYFVGRVRPVVEDASKVGRRVLLVIDGTSPLLSAVHLARRLAAADGGVVIPLIVSVDGSDPPASARLEELTAALDAHGLDCEVIRRHGRAWSDVVGDTALVEQATAVVTMAASTSELDASLHMLLDASQIPVFAVLSGRRIERVQLSAYRAELRPPHTETIATVQSRLTRAGIEVQPDALDLLVVHIKAMAPTCRLALPCSHAPGRRARQ